MKSFSVRALSLGVADQAFSSLTNFALTIVVARSVSTRDFGGFAIAFATYLVTLGLMRAITTEPFAIRFADVSRRQTDSAIGITAGLSLLIGCVAGLLCFVSSLLVPSALGGPLLALAVSLPGLLVQDQWRFVFFATQRGRLAFTNDVVWAVIMTVPIAAFMITDSVTSTRVILGWGLSAGVAAIFGMWQAGTVPRFVGLADWLKSHRDLSSRFVTEFLLLSASIHLLAYVLGIISGLAATGALRAGQTLMGPLNILFMGVQMVVVPESRRRARQGGWNMLRAHVGLGVGLSMSAALWGSVALLLPDQIGTALLGPTWTQAQLLLPPLIVSGACSGAIVGAATILRATESAAKSLHARSIASVLLLVGGCGGAILGDARGAAWGLAAAAVIATFFWWWDATSVMRQENARGDATISDRALSASSSADAAIEEPIA